LREAAAKLLRTAGVSEDQTDCAASLNAPATPETQEAPETPAAPQKPQNPPNATHATDAAPRELTREQRRTAAAVGRRREAPRAHGDRKSDEWEKRFRERYEREHPGQSPPPCIPRHVWLTCMCLLLDGSGKFAKAVLRKISNKVFVGAVRDAALAPLPGDAGDRYDWSDKRARYVLAIGYAIHSMAYQTNRRGWSGLCRGLGRHALLTLVRDPFRATREPWCETCQHRHPSVSALSGTHRADGSLETGQIGWLRALEEAGAISRQQFKAPDTIAAMCHPWEIGDAGYPINWYWLPSAVPVGLSATELALAQRLHDRGWDAPTEVICRRESYARSPELQAQPP
jgi:hypothetical protein